MSVITLPNTPDKHLMQLHPHRRKYLYEYLVNEEMSALDRNFDNGMTYSAPKFMS